MAAAFSLQVTKPPGIDFIQAIAVIPKLHMINIKKENKHEEREKKTGGEGA